MKIMLLGYLNKNESGNIYGGAEKSLIGLANWLANHTQHSISLVSVEGNVRAYPVDAKITFIGYEIKTRAKIRKHLLIMSNTVDAIKRINPDIIISFWIHPLFYAKVTGMLKNRDYYYSERNDPQLEYGRISRIMRKSIILGANAVICQTSEAANYFDKIKKNVGIVIHNPVYIKYEKYPIYRDNEHRIVTVGRLNKQKNHELLIKAFSKLPDKYKNYKLEIYGEGPLKENLLSLIKKLKMETRIFLMGTCLDVIDKIYGADLFVLPSIYEGMPNALMEAMAIGIPCISSDCPCGGSRELLSHGKNGFLFKCGSQENLLHLMIEVIEMNEAQKNEICTNGKNICNTHSQDAIFNEWTNLIQKYAHFEGQSC